MLKNLKDIADYEVDLLVGTISGMTDMQEDAERFFRDELNQIK